MSDHTPSRRALLAATGSAGAALLAGCLGSATSGDDPAANTPGPSATSTAPPVDYGGALAGANGWTGPGSTVDRRGESTVTVRVGAGEEGLSFDPVGVHVDAGTTVRWEWTGEGGSHDVHAVSGAGFESRVDAEGDVEWTAPDEPTTVRYECRPHTSQGERGVVVVE
jgi:halocyanin-like protein